MTKVKKEKNKLYTSSDKLKEIGMDLLFLVILYLFFKSYFIILVLPICIFVYHKINKRKLIQRYKEKISVQFKEFLISLTASIRTGYSIENALKEANKEMQVMYGKDEPICIESQKMINQISLAIPIENVLEDFASRCDVEDISTFAAVFKIAKRTGGDMVEIIKKTTSDITSKIDTKNEIAVLISSKKLEQNIMSIMPLAIICYVDLTSKGLLDPLYGNIKGVLIMSGCLVLYALAYFFGQKIMRIEV